MEPRVKGRSLKSFPRRMDKRKKKARLKKMERQEKQNQEEPERERVRVHLVTKPKTEETCQEESDRDQIRPCKKPWGHQKRIAKEGSNRGQGKIRTRKEPQPKKRRTG